MEYLSVIQYAEKYGISERTARNYCASGKIKDAFLTGKTWNIPADAPLPRKGKTKCSPLLTRLVEEKESKLKGGIYHRTQIDLTYNSNHIEGSRLTKEQTRYIFETNTLGITTETLASTILWRRSTISVASTISSTTPPKKSQRPTSSIYTAC